MSKFEFRLPDIGEGVTEGEIVNWLVNAGDDVREDQEMVEVMTDKATVTIGAPKRGRVVERKGNIGDTIAVGSVLVVLDTEGAGGQAATAPATAPAPVPERAAPAPAAPPTADTGTSAVGDLRETLPGLRPQEGNGHRPTAERPLAAPATRKLARELGVDLRSVQPSGPAGRITREDVERARERPAQPASREAEAPAARNVPPPAPPPRTEGDERVPVRGMRKRIFENMARSKHTAAHFTYVDECDAGELVGLRDRTRPIAERAGVKVTFLPFIVKAVVAALKKHPQLNCWVDDAANEIILKKSYDVGIATATDAGLIVPVVRGADRLSILDIAREIERLGTAAKAGKTQKEDLGASTFTITSLGKQGGLFATPVINYPEVAILGVHEMKRRPVVRGDQIVIGEVMLLSLSFDHRVIDGHVGAAFAQSIIGYLQEPDRLLVEMS